MRNTIINFGKWAGLLLAIMSLAAQATIAQQKTRTAIPERKFDLGRGMSEINTDLMQIAAQTDLFLQLADELEFTPEQRKKLEDMYFEVQKFSLRRQTDLDVAEAELRRLLGSDEVDVAAVRGKLKEIEALRAARTMKSIEVALRAIATLTHDQHLKIMLLARRLSQPTLPPAADG